MADNIIKTRIKQRCDTLANWQSKNPILLEGEVARVRMEDNTVRTKTGDGTSAFNSLSWDDKNLYDNNTATPKIGDSNVVWGGPNLISNTSPIDAAMIPDLGANRFAFLPPDAITVEYSRDGGSTWIDYGLSDSDKIKMFSGLSPSIGPVIGHIGSGSENCTTDCKLRITITTQSNNIVYATIKKFVINISTGYATGSNVTIEHSTFGNPDNFYVIQANVPIGGWTGYNVINNFNMRFGGSETQIYNFQKIRLTFGITGVDESHPKSALQVLNIYGFGGDVWRTPSNMAKTGHIYSYDEFQNAIFPSKVKSSTIPNEENDLINKKYVDGKAAEKLDKVSSYVRIYPGVYATTETDGTPHLITATSDLGYIGNSRGYIPLYETGGQLKTATPTEYDSAANKGYVDGKISALTNKYELIETITLTEATASIERSVEPDGTAYNFKKLIIYMNASLTNKTGAFGVNLWDGTTLAAQHVAFGSDMTQTKSDYIMELSVEDGILHQTTPARTDKDYLPSPTKTAAATFYGGVKMMDKISKIQINQYNGIAFTVGTVIKIYGVRA